MIDATKFIKALKLTVLSPSSRTQWDVRSADLHRPGLPFAGYYDHFAYERPQLIGRVEMSYLESLPDEILTERLEKFFTFPMPCIIICRGMEPPQELLDLARAHDVAVLGTPLLTTTLHVNAVNYLAKELAQKTNMHGVLMDVYGIGVLITGESGVGKSEAALELVKRGHQLVADDVVSIRKPNDAMLIGEAPETIRHFMEIRGIGVINIRALYGVGAVLTEKPIDLVIHMENWDDKKNYDRLGLQNEYTSIMGVEIPRVLLPVRPGRNLAIIIEVASRNFRLKQMGYSAAAELDRRLNDMRTIK